MIKNRMKKLQSWKTLVFLAALSIGILTAVRYGVLIWNDARPNVVLITIDALRADHLGCYGYRKDTSPNIDLFAKDAVIFSQCYSTSSSTTTATPGLLTGRYLLPSDCTQPLVPLSGKYRMLAEYLKKAGYFTAGLVTNGVYMGSTGYERGFDFYPSSSRYFPEMRQDFISAELKGGSHASDVNADKFTTFSLWSLRLMSAYSRPKPFFLWLHYIDPHAPYAAPEKFQKMFEDAISQVSNKNETLLRLNPHPGQNRHLSNGFIPPIVFKNGRYDADYYRASYDAEICFTDFHLARLLQEIPENSIVVITADHGESLGEHGVYFSHGENIYDELLHIPLIIRDKGFFRRGVIVDTPVSAVDIVPTILKRVMPLWYFFNRHRFDGRALQDVVRSGISRGYVYSYGDGRWSIRQTKGNIKYILNKDGSEELFRLPDEEHNRLSTQEQGVAEVRERLRNHLELWLRKYPLRSDDDRKDISPPDSVKDNLRSIGYLQ